MPPATEPAAKAHKQGTINAFDKYGRPISITRGDWLNSVLLGNVEKAWNDSDEPAGALNDQKGSNIKSQIR